MRTCDSCGCYIPDLWESCPACGRKRLPAPPSGGSSAQAETNATAKRAITAGEGGAGMFLPPLPDLIEVRCGTGQEEVMRFPVPKPSRPKTISRRKDGEEEDLDLLDATDAEILTRAIAYNGLDGNTTKGKTVKESLRFTSTPVIWSSDPNATPYCLELESYWPWSEIKLHQGSNR